MNRVPLISSACAIMTMLAVTLGCSERKDPNEQFAKVLEARGVDLKQPIVFPEVAKFADEAELTGLCEAFMREFGRGAIDAAFNLLAGRAAWPDAEMNALREKTKSQLALIGPRYGDFVGHEFIRSEMVGTSLVRYVYLAKLQNHPLRCTFLFYKPADKWILNSFIWDDQLKLLWEPGGQ